MLRSATECSSLSVWDCYRHQGLCFASYQDINIFTVMYFQIHVVYVFICVLYISYV